MTRHQSHKDDNARHFTHGTSASTADMAVDGEIHPEDRSASAPHSRAAKPLPKGKKHDQLGEKAARSEDRQEALLDEALEETFPGSDPVAPKRIT